jgi:hypothetical protein
MDLSAVTLKTSPLEGPAASLEAHKRSDSEIYTPKHNASEM